MADYCIGWSLICLGASLKVLSKIATDAEPINQPYFQLCCLGLALTLILFNIVRLSHPFKLRHPFIWVQRLLLILAIALAPVYAINMQTRHVLMLFATFSLLHAAIDGLGFDMKKGTFQLQVEKGNSELHEPRISIEESFKGDSPEPLQPTQRPDTVVDHQSHSSMALPVSSQDIKSHWQCTISEIIESKSHIVFITTWQL